MILRDTSALILSVDFFMRFAQKGAVVPHKRTHTGEKPYACLMCPMRFANTNAARADPQRGEAVRLLNVPDAVQRQGLRSPARADPHGLEAIRLLDVIRRFS